MHQELRSSVWNVCCQNQTLRKKILQGSNFWIGLTNRLRSKKPANLKEKLKLANQAQKIEEYLSIFPDYLASKAPDKQQSRQEELLGKYCQESGLELEIWGELGYGAFGTAYLALDSANERLVCLKLIDVAEVNKYTLDFDIQKRVEYEDSLKEIFHDKIIQIHGLFKSSEVYVFQLEYFPGVNLVVCWDKILEMHPKEKLVLLKRVIEGIKCLHLFEWIHRDIHPSNVLMDIIENMNIKIIDFGLSKKTEPEQQYSHSIPGYGHSDSQPPEIRSGKITSGQAIDIWAFGALAYKLLANTTDPYEVVTSDKTVEDFPSELDQDIRKILASSLASDPTKRPTANQIHNAICSWSHKQYSKQLYEESAHYRRLMEAHIEYLSNIGANAKIQIKAENGDANIYFQDGQLIEAEYGEMRGMEVLEELEDEVNLLHRVDLHTNVQVFPSANPQMQGLNVTGFLLEQAKNNDTFRTHRTQIQELVKQCLNIEDNKVLCEAKQNCVNSTTDQPKVWEFDNLLCGANVFMYGRDRHHLKSWCQQCIINDVRNRKGNVALASPYQGYEIAYFDQNLCAQFYLGFLNRKARFFNLYLKPARIKASGWMSILKRIKRGYDILGDYPNRYFINFKHFRPIKQDEEKFAILSMEYFPSIYLRQMLNAEIELSETIKAMILFDLARGLLALHSKEVVHRNINPSSILMGINGQMKIGDFSLCKYDPNSPADEDYYQVTVNVTQQHPMGVLLYSSPEHIDDMGMVTTRSDIWSWGVVAYELLAGASPFKRSTPSLGLRAIKCEEADMEKIPLPFKELVSQALIKNHEERILTAEDIVRQLYAILFPE